MKNEKEKKEKKAKEKKKDNQYKLNKAMAFAIGLKIFHEDRYAVTICGQHTA